jgi:hypothetical protein
MSRCQRAIVSGVTSSRRLWRRAVGITLSSAARRACACRKPRPGHATRRYSLTRPPTRVCRRTRYWSRSTGSGSGFSGAAPCRQRCGRCLVMVALVVAQDPPQMVLVPDEGAVRELAAASADPAFGDRVHAGRPHVAQHGPDPGVGEDRVEGVGEVGAPVADHEFDSLCLLAEVHEQVCGPAGRSTPRSGAG